MKMGGSRIMASCSPPRVIVILTYQPDRPPPAPPGRTMPTELTKPARLGQPPPGVANQNSLDRSASHRTPPTHPPKTKTLDRANTTRAPGTKGSPPQAVPLAKSHSQQGSGHRAVPPSSQAAALARQHTQGKQQAAAGGPAPRRRDKAKENEDVIRQLQAICSPGDPSQIYRNLQKVGQGCATTQVWV